MKKTKIKIFLYVEICMLVLYIVFILITFGVYKGKNDYKFQEFYSNFDINVLNFNGNLSDENNQYTPDMLMYNLGDLTASNHSSLDMNVIVKCYNSDKNVIAESGDMIQIVNADSKKGECKTENIFLDKFLSTKELNKVYLFFREHKPQECCATYIEGYYKNKNFIPTKIVFSNIIKKNKITINLSSTKPMVKFNYNDKISNLYTVLYYKNDLPKSIKEQNKLKTIFDESTELYLKRLSIGSGSATFDSKYDHFEGSFKMGEGKDSYYIVYAVSCNISDVTFKSEEFKITSITTFITTQVAALIIYFVVLSLYKKQEALDDARINLTNAIAHELKTPLAIIKSNCDCINENINSDKNELYLNNISDETNRMNSMIISMLDFAKLKSGNYKLKKEECMLDELVSEVIESNKQLIEDKSINLIIDFNNCKPVECDRELIKIVISNFISNAIRYMASGKKIIATVKEVKKGICVSIENESSQINNTNLKNIWDAFYRGDDSRKRDENSTGLGLAIAQSILDLHKAGYGCEYTLLGIRFYFIIK